MELTPFERRLVAILQEGLPLEPRPYAAVAAKLGTTEAKVIDGVRSLQSAGHIKRMGIVVRHHELGYQANAMVVWDVPDERLGEAVKTILTHPFVTLCYRRPRCLPDWPYNLFCMIHGKRRDEVLQQIAVLNAHPSLSGLTHAVLFSKRRFKQRGARYQPVEAVHG